MAVQHEVGAVLRDRRREAVAAEDHVDALGLALDRRPNRRVVQEHDAESQCTTSCRPLRDRLGVVRRLRVDLAQQRLAEVGERRAGKAADEPLRPDDPELELRRSRTCAASVRARARPPPRSRPRSSSGALRVEVVVAEHREDRDVERRGTRPRRPPPARARRVVVRSPASRIDVRLARDVANARSTRSASPRTRAGRRLLRCGSRLSMLQRSGKTETPWSCPSLPSTS